jgi:hypothetical protein
MPDNAKSKVQRAVNDPDFLGLSADDQRKVLAGVSGDSAFLSIDNGELFKFTTALKGQTSPAYQQANTPGMEPGQYQASRGAPIVNPVAAGQAPGQITASNPITQLPGETFAGTIQRAVEAGRQVTQAQIQEETRQNIRKAPVVLAAAPAMGFAQPAAMGAVGGLAAPTTTTAEVGTGILDATGQEITREVLSYGPSLGKQALQTMVKWVAGNPVKAGVAYEFARRFGIPLPNLLGLVMKGITPQEK